MTPTPVVARLPLLPPNLLPDQLAAVPPPPVNDYRPQIIAELPEIEDIPLDAAAIGTNAFLESAGATEIVRQFEMLKRIDGP